MKTHPAVDVFPRMTDAEIADLAADIKRNGLLMPIITMMLDGEETIVDGRERLRACEIAGVAPRFKALPEDTDPAEYTWIQNTCRVNYTRSQRVMAIATLYHKPCEDDPPSMAGGEELRMAREIVAYNTELARSVIAGARRLAEAWQLMNRRAQEQATAELEFQHIKKTAPDLAELILDGEVSLDDASARLEYRELSQGKKRRQKR